MVLWFLVNLEMTLKNAANTQYFAGYTILGYTGNTSYFRRQ